MMSSKIYRQYDPAKLAQALESVRNNTLSQRRASKVFGIPKTTLNDKLAGRVLDKAASGPPPVLTTAEERVLVDYLSLMAQIGYPIRRMNLLLEVKRVLDVDGRRNPFKNNMPGKDWFKAFCRRNPGVAERVPQKLATSLPDDRTRNSTTPTTAYFQACPWPSPDSELDSSASTVISPQMSLERIRALPPQTSCSNKIIATPKRAETVSSAFDNLNVPELHQKTRRVTPRDSLPKALSGRKAIEWHERRAAEKKEEEEAKQKRKEDRETKRKARENEKQRKQLEREKKKQEREQQKKEKEEKKHQPRRRKKKPVIMEESESESEAEIPYMDSEDDDFEDIDTNMCCMWPRKW